MANPIYPVNRNQFPIVGNRAKRARLANLDQFPNIVGGPAQPVVYVTDADLAAGTFQLEGNLDFSYYEVGLQDRVIQAGPAIPVYLSNPGASPSGGGQAAFTPTQIAGLKLWLDAADATTLFQNSALSTPAVADADPVGGWKDKSGSGFNALQASSGKRPLLKKAIQAGRDVLLFDGVDDNLKATFASIAQPYTLYVLNKFVDLTVTGTDKVVVIATSDAVLRAQGAAPTTALAYAGTGLTAASYWNTTSFIVSAFVVNGASSILYKNAVSAASGAAGALGWQDMYIASYRDAAQAFSNMYAAEILLYAGAHTPAQVAQVTAYLNARWAAF